MSEKNESIKHYTPEELRKLREAGKTGTDWQFLQNMSQEEADKIACEDNKNFADDQDWQGINLEGKLGWRVVRPDGSAIFPITLDAKLTKFVQETHLDYQTFLVGALKDYAESQQKL